MEEAERWGEQVLQPMPRRIFRWMAAREYVVRRWLGFGDLAPYLQHHPAIRWAETVVPALPGPVPPALPREWLRPLERV